MGQLAPFILRGSGGLERSMPYASRVTEYLNAKWFAVSVRLWISNYMTFEDLISLVLILVSLDIVFMKPLAVQ